MRVMGKGLTDLEGRLVLLELSNPFGALPIEARADGVLFVLRERGLFQWSHNQDYDLTNQA